MVSPHAEDSEVSNPVKRIRWATHRAKGQKGDRKRESLLARAVHRRTSSKEKPESPSQPVSGTDTVDTEEFSKDQEDDGSEQEQSTSDDGGRRIFFSVPLPDDARDSEGHPLAHFGRNKIRTAKYTPISFIPKNLWFQFHNVANIYFLFIIILGVSKPLLTSRYLDVNSILIRFSASSVLPILA
jgi:phospholipid-translocating ATPase